MSSRADHKQKELDQLIATNSLASDVRKIPHHPSMNDTIVDHDIDATIREMYEDGASERSTVKVAPTNPLLTLNSGCVLCLRVGSVLCGCGATTRQ
jgi:hypothetical protein